MIGVGREAIQFNLQVIYILLFNKRGNLSIYKTCKYRTPNYLKALYKILNIFSNKKIFHKKTYKSHNQSLS